MLAANQMHHQPGQQEQEDSDHVHGTRTRDVEEAADRRPDDHRRLRGRRIARDCAWKHRARHQCRQERRHRRHLESAPGADDKDQREDRVFGDPALETAESQTRRGERLDNHANLEDDAPVESVGDVAGDQHQQERRNELREADKTEVERAAGQRIDLPTHADGEHLIRDHRGDPRKPIQNERALREQRSGCRFGRPARILDLSVPSSSPWAAPSRAAGALAASAAADRLPAQCLCLESRETRRSCLWSCRSSWVEYS